MPVSTSAEAPFWVAQPPPPSRDDPARHVAVAAAFDPGAGFGAVVTGVPMKAARSTPIFSPCARRSNAQPGSDDIRWFRPRSSGSARSGFGPDQGGPGFLPHPATPPLTRSRSVVRVAVARHSHERHPSVHAALAGLGGAGLNRLAAKAAGARPTTYLLCGQPPGVRARGKIRACFGRPT
jgi:hypothetical protein